MSKGHEKRQELKGTAKAFCNPAAPKVPCVSRVLYCCLAVCRYDQENCRLPLLVELMILCKQSKQAI
ncbi:MAG: hypothetical protein LBJ67_00670 [Planctomycetaceae bacterium]|nr:hypothetical protein [Planctomycetaceae bacterium]